MSVAQLADHLNRNKIPTSYSTEYAGERGTFTLVRETWKWLQEELDLEDEAQHVARAFVKTDGTYAYE